jgi:molybdopterin-guanine dinucleotide biosynthesis adapter protein
MSDGPGGPIIIGIAGFSGSGKTTLIERLIPLLVARGKRVAVIKHAHHEFDVDHVGKDSYRHRKAGSKQVMVSSSRRWVLMTELESDREPTLGEHIALLAPCDVIIVEGYKRDPIRRIEVRRSAAQTPPLFVNDPFVVALATDHVIDTSLPQFPLDAPERVADFILTLEPAA